ncbi:MAG: hypothetical protein KGZ68_15680 [Dechloromonas sp.]|jgi:hypothetical protein|nr:hypothetical protein [Dechloromonas sp.]
MDYLGVGVCLVLCAELYRKGNLLNKDVGGWFVMGFLFVFGLFFVVAGGIGVYFDSSLVFPSAHGKIVLFVSYYYLLVHARVLSLAIETDSGLDFYNKKGANIFEITRVAFSGGWWLFGRPCSILINFSQAVLIVIVVLFVKGML